MAKKKNKQVNTKPGETPFRKGQGTDESYGIPEDRANIDAAFDQFQSLTKDQSEGG